MNALNILQPQAKKLLIPLMPGPVILTPPKKNEKATDVSLFKLETYSVFVHRADKVT